MTFKIGIHYEPLKQFQPRLKRYEKIIAYNGQKSIRLSSSEPDFWHQVRSVDLFIYYWGQWDAERQNAKAIMPIIENEIGVTCFPNQRTAWMFDDKIREYYLMLSQDYPMVKSWVFWESDDALKWAENAELPVVFKLSGGAGSKNVILINNRSDLSKIIKMMFNKGINDNSIRGFNSLGPNYSSRLLHNLALLKRRILGQQIPHRHICSNWNTHKHYVLFQQFLPNNRFDTRVTTIGKRAFAFRRFTRDADFRSSGSGKIDYDVSSIDLGFVAKAIEISSAYGFQTMAYDFLYDLEGQARFCEMSYAYIDSAVFNCSGYWDDKLNWHEGHFWPQYFHLMDALDLPQLKHPDVLT